jgi:hypothetical protein
MVCRQTTVVLMMMFVAAATAEADEAGLDFKAPPAVPVMAVGPTQSPPEIDGTIKPGEWDDAAAVSTLQQWGAALAHPGTTAYVTYDRDRIYFAFACAKEKPTWYGARNRFRDSQVYLDPDVELYLSPDNADGKTIIYQFCFNAYGAIFDVRAMPAIGLTEPGYNPKIELRTTQTSGEWIVEGSIAIADLDPRGFADGQIWRANFVRSWPQRAWSLRGGPYIARDAMGEMHLSGEAPAIQWLDVNSLNDGRLDLRVAVKNRTARPQRYQLAAQVTGESAADELAAAEQVIDLHPGERRELRLAADATFAGKRGHALLKVTGGDRTWYRQAVRFDKKHAGAADKSAAALRETPPVPREMSVSARYGPLSNALEVQADVWSLVRAGATPAAVELAVVADGAEPPVLVPPPLTHFQKDLAIARVQLADDLPFGNYTLRAVAKDSGGAVLSSAEAKFERVNLADEAVNRPRQARQGRILDWMHSDAGVTQSVPQPWTPVRAAGNIADGWGRRITLDHTGLPAHITAVGQSLLAEPVGIEALIAGQPVRPTGKDSVEIEPNVHASGARWSAATALSPQLTLHVDGRLEFDGLMRFAVRLEGEDRAKLDRLTLNIPLRAEVAERMLLPTGIGRVPAAPAEPGAGGPLWESRTVRDDELMGTLIPCIWLGTAQAGLTWAADHTRGWVEKPGESVLTLDRDAAGNVILRVHLVQEAGGKFDHPMEFSLLPTPTKPLPAGWRNYATTDDWNYFWFTGWFGMQQREKKDGKETIRISWDDPPAAAMEKGPPEAREKNQRMLPLPYNNPQFTVPHPMPWVVTNESPMAKLLLEEWANIPSRWGPVKPVASYRDWAADTMRWWIEQQGYGGYYIDEAYGSDGPDMNLLNGSGWFDRHRNLRGSYHGHDTREMLRRMYVLTQQHAPRPFLLVHTSSFGMAPLWGSFATATCSGEGDWEVHIPGQSLLDRLPPETLELASGKAFGFMATFFGDKMKGDPELMAQSRRQIHAELMLYDMLPNARENDPESRAVRRIKTEFGIGEGDVRFHGYWMPQPPATSSNDSVRVSTFSRPGQTLLVVVNFDRANPQATNIAADLDRLSLSPLKLVAMDPETWNSVGDPARLALELPPRGVRWIVLQNVQAGSAR